MDTLIDRYLNAVSENLPARLRKDTVTEIRSLIQDALDDRSKEEGRPPDNEMMVEVLKQFGSPQSIVAPYLPEKYLIGPRLFPTFNLVISIVLPILAVLSMIGFWAGYSQPVPITGVDLVANIAKSIGNMLSAVIQGFGNIVIIFAILQWVLPDFRIKPKEWDPRSLKAVRQPDKIKRGELITEIFFSLIGLIVFTFYIDKIGIYNYVNGQWTFTPILTSAFNNFIPWLDLLWVITILLNTILLRRGAWEYGTRLFAIALYAFGIGISTSFLTSIPYIYTLQGAFGQLGGASILQSLINQVLIVAFAVAILVNALKIIKMLLNMVRGRING
jgi:hypothetical protein